MRNRTDRSRHRPIVLMLALGVALLGGCGDAGDSPEPAPILSDPTSDVLSDPTGASAAFISVDKREAALDQVLSVVGGALYEPLLAASRPLFELSDPTVSLGGITRLAADEGDGGGSGLRRYSCDDGGELIVSGRGDTGATDDYTEIDALDCIAGGLRFAGKLILNDGTRYVQAFSMTGPGNERREMSGSIVDQGDSRGSLRVSSYRQTTASGETIVTDARTDVTYSPDDAASAQSLFAAARVSSPATGGAPLIIDTPELFRAARGERNYTSGRLSASSDDGAQLVLNAADGNPGTFQLVVTAEGSISAFLLDWSDERRLPCVTDDSGACR